MTWCYYMEGFIVYNGILAVQLQSHTVTVEGRLAALGENKALHSIEH